MSALRQPNFSPEYYSLPHPIQKKNNHNKPLIKNPKAKSVKTLNLGTFPKTNTLPKNLQILSLLQKGSFGLALVSMTASIGLYMSTVQIPKLWSQEYQNLETLQRQERQLIAINETIKYQVAQEAGLNNSLSISKPDLAVFIPPAKVSLKTQPEHIKNQQKSIELKHTNLGY